MISLTCMFIASQLTHQQPSLPCVILLTEFYSKCIVPTPEPRKKGIFTFGIIDEFWDAASDCITRNT
ncbi:unnamed protein product [Schistosoma rodhaini]|nr:unnamed protein product [Schistosoma rodhaini]